LTPGTDSDAYPTGGLICPHPRFEEPLGFPLTSVRVEELLSSHARAPLSALYRFGRASLDAEAATSTLPFKDRLAGGKGQIGEDGDQPDARAEIRGD